MCAHVGVFIVTCLKQSMDKTTPIAKREVIEAPDGSSTKVNCYWNPPLVPVHCFKAEDKREPSGELALRGDQSRASHGEES